MKPRRWRMLATLAATALVVACGDDDETSLRSTDPPATGDSDAAFEQLVEAAQAEGTLTLYATPTENVVQAIASAFSEKYGIETEFIRLSGSDMEQRYSAEAAAGTFVADAILGTEGSSNPDRGFYAEAAQQGWIVDLADAGIPGFPWEFPTEFIRNSRATVQIQPWLIEYNTEIVEDPPDDWADLLDERFRDLIVFSDPVTSSANTQFWLVIEQEYGEEWFEGFRAQNGRMFEGGVPAHEALAAGEGGIHIPSVATLAQDAIDRGAPVDITIPDTTTGVEIVVAITDPAKSRHPNAARLFTAYVMSEEGLSVLNDFEGLFSPTDTSALPSDYVSPPDFTDEDVARLQELTGAD